MWYQKFDTFIWGLSFTRSKADHCVYFKVIGDRVIYLVLYVDNMLLVGNDQEIIEDLKTQLSSKFGMKDLGAANYIFGMEIKRDQEKRKLWLKHKKYVETILQIFNMQDSKLLKVPIRVGVKLSAEQCPKKQEEEEDMSRVPYASAVRRLMYAMVCTKLDITHEVGILSRFMSKLGKENLTAVKRVFRYLRGTSDYGLCLQEKPRLDRVLDIHSFVDTDWVGDLNQRRSTSGYVFNLFGGAIRWMRLSSSMGLVQQAIRIDFDSQSAIFLAKNPAYHSKTKHIDIQYHFVRDMFEEIKVLLVKVDTLKNTANALTKSVST
eukprot:PITA_31197